MYIVPIIHAEIQTDEKYSLIKCAMLLDRNGSSCLLNNSSVKEFCMSNELIIEGEPLVINNLTFVRINPVQTNLETFYTWSEVTPASQPMKEVWRYFIWNNEVNDIWGTNTYLDSIDCSPYSIGYLLKSYFSQIKA
jgi:hypothetical protein